jgi:ABC-2 type transport system permease protein
MKELFRYRDLIRLLVARDLKVRYRRSAIGLLWTLLYPMLLMLVFSVVFSTIFRFQIENFAVYALSGIIFWNFFSQVITTSMHSLRGNAALLTKLPVPKAVFPLATVLSGLLNLLFSVIPLLLLMVVTGHPLSPALLFLPVAVAIAAVLTLGMGLLLSPLAAFFSDTVELVGLLLTLLMYLTPIFYPMSIVPEHLRWIVEWNPLRAALDVFRLPIYLGKLPDLFTFTVAASVSLAILLIGAYVFQRTSRRIAFYI